MKLQGLQQSAPNLEKLILENPLTEEELFEEYRALKHITEQNKK